MNKIRAEVPRSKAETRAVDGVSALFSGNLGSNLVWLCTVWSFGNLHRRYGTTKLGLQLTFELGDIKVSDASTVHG